MKKVLIAALALMMGASLSLAGLGIDWSNNGGWMYAYGSDSEGVLENNDVLWQLIFSPDKEATAPDLKAENFLGEGEKLIAQREIPATGSGGTSEAKDKLTSWDEWLMPASGDTVTENKDWTDAGWAYQRIWQGIPSDSIAENYYFDSALVAIDTTYGTNPDAPSNPQAVDYSPDGNGVTVNKIAYGEGPEPPTPTVPEPATMSLLGLGALAMVIRRKLRK